MTRLFRTRVIGTVTMWAAAVALPTAQTPNVHIGTWNLNVAKSEYGPGPAPQSQTLRFEAWEDGLKATSDLVDAKATKSRLEFAAKFDGKPGPFKGM